jgi:hypothetical protein
MCAANDLFACMRVMCDCFRAHPSRRARWRAVLTR